MSFTIAPRVNAASRLDHPMKAFYMLSGANKTMEETIGFALELESINKTRKDTVNNISKYLSNNLSDFDGDEIVFTGSEEWPIGVAGLIATKIVEMTGKTTFVWGLDESGTVRGSSRSGKDKVSVMDLTASIKDSLLHFGGHEMAGGFSFIDGKQEEVGRKLNQNYKTLFDSNVTQETHESKTWHDFEYQGERLKDIYEEQEKLAPFGMANLAPIFKLKGEVKMREFGENKKHIELSVNNISIIKWNADKNIKDKIKNAKIFYANLEKDSWKNGHRFMLLDCE
jgi:single-stranded-DNA-specific exonuclease